MTKKGWKSVLMSESVFKIAQDFIEEFNRKLGYKKIRSMVQLVDMAIVNEIERIKKEGF